MSVKKKKKSNINTKNQKRLTKFYFYATVADATVGTSGWPVKSTGGTPFHAHLYGVHLRGLV